jgi:hypothetical protein
VAHVREGSWRLHLCSGTGGEDRTCTSEVFFAEVRSLAD